MRACVLVTPQDGWTVKVTTTRLKTPVKTDDGTITDAVSRITWSGGRIRSGEYQDFDVAFGQLPDDTGPPAQSPAWCYGAVRAGGQGEWAWSGGHWSRRWAAP